MFPVGLHNAMLGENTLQANNLSNQKAYHANPYKCMNEWMKVNSHSYTHLLTHLVDIFNIKLHKLLLLPADPDTAYIIITLMSQNKKIKLRFSIEIYELLYYEGRLCMFK